MDEILDIVGLSHSSWGLKRRKAIKTLRHFFENADCPTFERVFREYWNSEFNNDETERVIDEAILTISDAKRRNAVALYWNLYMTEPFFDNTPVAYLERWKKKPVFQLLDATHSGLLAYVNPQLYGAMVEPTDELYLQIRHVYDPSKWRTWMPIVFSHAQMPGHPRLDPLSLDDGFTV